MSESMIRALIGAKPENDAKLAEHVKHCIQCQMKGVRALALMKECIKHASQKV